MSFTGEIWGGGPGNTFEHYAEANRDFYQEHAGEPVVVRVSRGYWLGGYGNGHPDSHAWQLHGVSVDRKYSLGVLAAGREIEEQKRGLIIPVEGFVSWKTNKRYNDPRTEAWLTNDPPVGIDWIDAEVEEGKGDSIVVSPLTYAKDPDDRRLIDTRVKIGDKALGIDLEPSRSNGHRERFAAIDIASCKVLVKGQLNTAEGQDELLSRILDGEVSALRDAADPEIKIPAAQAAIPLAEEIERAEQEALDEWAGQFDI